jgi:hypothetical protein
MCVGGGEIDRNTSCDDCWSVDRVMSVAPFDVRGAVPSGSTVKGSSLLVYRMDGSLGESEIFIKYDELVV